MVLWMILQRQIIEGFHGIGYITVIYFHYNHFLLQMEKQASRQPYRQLEVQVNNTQQHHKDIDTRWVEIKFNQTFSPRSYFASSIQAGNIYIHGGFSAETGNLKDFYTCCLYDSPMSWKTIVTKNTKDVGPGALRNHSLTSYLSNLILFGGQKNVIENNKQIFKFNLLTNSWSKCKCINSKGETLNFALDSHCSFIYKNHLYIYGGYDSLSTQYFPDLIKINLENIVQNELSFEIIKCQGQKPSSRANTSYVLANGLLYLFGGGGNVDEVYADLWILNLESLLWTQINKKQSIAWPDKRKGATLIYHEKSNSIFLFGGFKKITKQQNDVMIYLINSKRWIKIHSSTNQLYDPSPTIKELTESPTIADEKRKREKIKSNNKESSQVSQGNVPVFKLGMKSVMDNDAFLKMNQTNFNFVQTNSLNRANTTQTNTDNFKRKISVVQQKKYRQFLNRKKKLLSNIELNSKNSGTKARKSHSPTSEALIYSLHCMGQQQRDLKGQLGLPKVIYDEEKGQVIGKKPCARDGHCALLHEETMIIIGGDRHKVTFNDAYFFKLNKGVETLPYYD